MFAVLQDHEVVEYYSNREDAENCALEQFELGYEKHLYVVELLTDYSPKDAHHA